MYEAFYGLKAMPFENTPDPEFFFESRTAGEALLRLNYGLDSRKGGVLLVGDYGCGKTLLVRRMIAARQADGKNCVAYVANPLLRPAELLREVVFQFSGELLQGDRVDTLRAFEDFLLQVRREGRAPLLVIDEAQSVTNLESLEEIRLLLNFQTDKAFLLTVLLCGQMEMIPLLQTVPQFLQRFEVRFRMGPLDLDEVGDYVRWRLRVAGAEGDIPFDPGAIRVLSERSQGVPRVINCLSDFALFAAMSLGRKKLDGEMMRKLCDEYDDATRF